MDKRCSLLLKADSYAGDQIYFTCEKLKLQVTMTQMNTPKDLIQQREEQRKVITSSDFHICFSCQLW